MVYTTQVATVVGAGDDVRMVLEIPTAELSTTPVRLIRLQALLNILHE